MAESSSPRNKKLTARKGRELDTKISFLEGIIRRDPTYVEALQILGDHYTERGRYENSLKIDQRLSALEPKNPLVFYNLACSYSLNGNLDEGVAALDRALALGYRDFTWLSRDPDLRSLRKHPAFRSIRDKIKRMKVKIV